MPSELAHPVLYAVARYAFAALLLALAALLFLTARARRRLDRAEVAALRPAPALVLGFSPLAVARLDYLVQRTQAGGSAEVVHRALALYDALVVAEGEGAKTYVLRDGSEPERVELP